MKAKNIYDDGNIPEIDLPGTNRYTVDTRSNASDKTQKPRPTDPLPESERPRKDGPGGE